MELNTAIWGDNTHQQAQTSAYSNTITISDIIPDLYAWYDEYTIESDIDNSIALWQLNDKSMFNRQLCLRRDNNGLLQKAYTSNVNAKSIWLCVPQTYNTNYNIHFNPAQSNCNLWDVNTISTFYKNSSAQYRRSIITGFDYNRLQLRVKLTCCKYDSSTHVHDASTVTLSIYQYYHDSDSNSLPYKDNYAINRLTIDVCGNNGVSTTNYIPIDKPITNSYNNQPAKIFTNTKYNTPYPSDGYYDTTYLYYAQNSTGIGLTRTNITTIPQQAAFAANNSYIIDGFDSNVWELDEFTIGTTNYIATRFTGDYDEMLRQIAYFGFWFNEADTGSVSINNVLGTGCTDNNVIMPEIVAGRTTGNFKRGTAAAADPQAAWGNQWRDSVGYNGDEPYRNAGDTGDLTSVFHRLSLGGSLTYYVGTPYAMDSLIGIINSGYQPANNDQFVLDFKGTNPADYVCTVMYYPHEFQCPYTAGTFTTIHIGAISPTFPPNLLAQADVEAGYYKEFSPINIPSYFNDFRDYGPFTTMSLYIPFCGTVDLDPALFIGHTLTVRLFIDYLTGNCTGVIMRDDTVIDSVSGSCGVSIPLTALNTGNYQNAIKSAEIALKQAEINRKTAWLGAMGALGTTLGGAAMGNPMAIGAGVAGAMGVVTAIQQTTLTKELAEYNLDHIAPAVCNVSAASPCNALGLDYDIHLLIKRCRTVEDFDESMYAQTVGHACCINDVLGNYSGLTVCSNVRLDSVVSDSVTIDDVVYGSNAATADEIALIRQALSDGVYM